MPDYSGGCHCGQVRLTVHKSEPITSAVQCDCSLCTKKGILLAGVEDSELELLQGREALSLYQFGSKTAHHWFCKHCGIHVFNRPRNHPERYSVNVRCLDDYRDLQPSLTIVPFDGQNHPKDRQG